MSDCCCGEVRIIDTGGGTPPTPLLRDNTQTSPNDRSGFDYALVGQSLNTVSAMQTARPETRNPLELTPTLIRQVPDHFTFPIDRGVAATSNNLTSLVGAGWTVLSSITETFPVNSSGRLTCFQPVVTLDVGMGMQGVHAVAVWRSWGNVMFGGGVAAPAWQLPNINPPNPTRYIGNQAISRGASPAVNTVVPLTASVTTLPVFAVIAPAETFRLEIGIAVFVDGSYPGPPGALQVQSWITGQMSTL